MSSMTPDDMAGRLEKLREWDTLHPPDFEALRALLLDYQERGRALEEIKALPDLSKNPADDFDRGARAARLDAADIARATLKGKSHD
jgi:hypothetical protein